MSEYVYSPADYNQLEYNATTLFNILQEDRKELTSFLKRSNFSHSDLKMILTYIKKNIKKLAPEQNTKCSNGSLIENIFLGNFGLESNKQQAIYELPTLELLTTIHTICCYFKVTKMEEIMAGSGLFSSLFDSFIKNSSEKFPKKIISTDGFYQMETFSLNRYYEVGKKDLLEYVIEEMTKNFVDEKKQESKQDSDSNKPFFSDTLIITAWPAINIEYEFTHFIKKVKPPLFILIGQHDLYPKYNMILKKENYHDIILRPLQICFKDSFTDNSNNLPDIWHSLVCVYIKDTKIDENHFINSIQNDVNNRLSKNCFRQEQIISDKYILKYLSETGFIPLSVLKNVTDEEIKDIINMIYKLFISKKRFEIPSFIKTIQEFKFWYELFLKNEFPTLITSSASFKNFLKLYKGLQENVDNLNYYVRCSILPHWVSNKNDAIRCLILDYSTKCKKWKESHAAMLQQISEGC